MDLNYDQFNGDALIFKYNLDEYGNPISIKVDKEEKQVSVHGTIQLEYVPDEYNRVVVLNEDDTQMTEVFNRDEIKPNTYYVDYNNGVVYLDKSQFGKTKIYNYYKKGIQLIGCSRIYDEHDVSGKHVVLTLQEIIDAGREALRFLLDIGDAKKVIELLESLIAEGKLTITNLENKKNECIQSINNAISQATQDKNEIVQEIQDNIQQAKDEVVNVAGNKEVIIRASDWALNIDVYEKEISHNLNSENLHVTAKNSDTKEAVTIGYKILDKTRILLKSDEPINMSVILSASYYHATQTISDDIAEEVVKARKGEASLDVKITKMGEQLDTIDQKKANTIDFNFIKKDGKGTKALLDNGTYADFSGGNISAVTLYGDLGYGTDCAITQNKTTDIALQINAYDYNIYDLVTTFTPSFVLDNLGVKQTTDISWSVSDFIKCDEKVFKIKTIAKNNLPCIAFYSQSTEESFVKAIYPNIDITVLGTPMKAFDGLVYVPSGANYMRFINNTFDNEVINKYREFKYYNTFKSEYKNNKLITDNVLKSDNTRSVDSSIILQYKDCRLLADGSVDTNRVNWAVSDFIEIKKGTIVTGYCISIGIAIAIYDKNKKFVIAYNPDTGSGDVLSKTLNLSLYEGYYVRLQSNTTLNQIANYTYNGTIKDDIKELLESSVNNKLPYQSGNIYFSVKVNQNFPTNGTTQTCEDTETLADIPCVLKLPATYTQNGTPTKLIMTCHGAGGSVSNNSISSAGGHDCIINGGFAWFDVNGSCDNSEHMSGIRALEAYKKAYDYIIKNYNIDPIILVHGRSMGGLTALNFTYHFPSIVSACACVYPVTDLYNQAWLRPWSSTCKQNMAIEYNFNDKTGNTFEEDKVIGFNPIKNNTFTISDNSYTNFPVPLKIWHGLADTTVRIDESRKLVSAIKNYGGRASIREIEGMTHTLSNWLWNETFIWLKRYS